MLSFDKSVKILWIKANILYYYTTREKVVFNEANINKEIYAYVDMLIQFKYSTYFAYLVLQSNKKRICINWNPPRFEYIFLLPALSMTTETPYRKNYYLDLGEGTYFHQKNSCNRQVLIKCHLVRLWPHSRLQHTLLFWSILT